MKSLGRTAARVAAVWVIGGVALTVGSAWGLALIPHTGAVSWSGIWIDARFLDDDAELASTWMGCRRFGRTEVAWTSKAHERHTTQQIRESLGLGPDLTAPVDDPRIPRIRQELRRALIGDLGREIPRWLPDGRAGSLAASHPFDAFRSSGFGWPFVALSHTIQDVPRGGRQFIRGIAISWGAGGKTVDRALPLDVYWPGFVANTLAIGAIATALLLGPGALRQMIRTRRGRCTVCAYSLAGIASNFCPECGRVIEERKHFAPADQPPVAPEHG
jgi:hypothetical protein